MQTLEQARAQLEVILRDPLLDARANALAEERNHQHERALQPWLELKAEHAAREAQMTKFVSALNAKFPDRPARLAEPGDHRRDLEYRGKIKDVDVELFRGRDGVVVFDGRKLRSNLAGVSKGEVVRINESYEVQRVQAAHRARAR